MHITLEETHESTSIPGAQFKIRRTTDVLRNKIEDELAPYRAKLAKHYEAKLDAEQIDDPKEKQKVIREADKAIDEIVGTNWDKTYIQNVLLSTGIEVGPLEAPVEVKPDYESLRQFAPSAYLEEILKKILERLSLGGGELKNSESPSTSSAQ